jgi:hypothetical protein
MRAGTLAAAIAAALVAAAPAHAVNLATPDGQAIPFYQRWVDAAKVPTPDATVVIRPTGCPFGEEPACTWPLGPIHFDHAGVAWSSDHPAEVRGTLLHELGHQYDYLMPERARARFARIMRDARPWRTSPNSPHEQFAEAYAHCGLGGKAARRYGLGGYDYSPSVRQRRAACRLIRSL